MTSDAKIGLLLGLVFIFIIAFLINGLPSLRQDKNNNELTTNTPALGAKERKAREVIEQIGPIKKQPVAEVPTTVTENQGIRFEMPVPENTSIVKDVSIEKAAGKVKAVPLVLIADKQPQVQKLESAKPTRPKTYAVADGDNLATIAQKFYGHKEGNKRGNILRIFEANRNLLKSPDEIYVGQKLTIPSLPASALNKDKKESVLPGTMFEQVKSIGQRRLLPDSPGVGKTKQSREYIVREGDSLWRIAAEQLGNANRYTEVSKLNADILEDEDTLVVGMRLRLPG